MQLRLFRHFVPVSVLILVSSDTLLITGAFYQLLSEAQFRPPIVFGVANFNAQFAAGLSAAVVAAMLSRGAFSVILGRVLFKRRVLVLGKGIQAARIAKLVERGQNDHFTPVSFVDV